MKNLVFISVIVLMAVFLFSNNILAASPIDISIIEVGAFEKSGYEYIKIYNNTETDINLDGWKFTENFSDSDLDGTNHTLKEFNSGYIIPSKKEAVITQDPQKFLENNVNYQDLILDSSWSSLNESGEKIQIVDNEDNIIESFIYLSCPEAPLKRINYNLADYSSQNWKENISTIPTENITEINSSSNNTEKAEPIRNSSVEKPKIIINEILANPVGSDNTSEFIELKNIGDTTICLNNWQVQDGSKSVYEIYNEYYSLSFIRPNQFFVIYRDISKIALNNNGDSVKLIDNNGTLIDSISYTDAKENISYARNTNNSWDWTPILTPDKENNIPPKNNAPIISTEFIIQKNQVNFDASDSYDPDRDNIFFMWNFGDGNSSTLVNPTNTYKNNGIYEVTLSVFDSQDNVSKSNIKITINDPANQSTIIDKDYKQNLIISEILPNPAGSDEEEFIEIYNPNNESINLKNWSLKDNSNKKPWVISTDTIISSEEYLVFSKTETKISLNNTEDSVKLLDANNNIISEVFYDKAQEAMSYNFDISKNQWSWNYNTTPWEENDITEKSIYNNYLFTAPLSAQNNYQKIELSEIREYELGSLIETTGIVTAPPGLLGKQIFYINGVQIYMYSQDFPALKVGDNINILGELTEVKKELRIKVQNIEDITILTNNEEPEITETYIENIDDNLLGYLIKINGEITEHKSDTLWLDDDTAEIKVYINKYTGIKLAKTEPGQSAEIVGILSNSTSGYRLLPRYQEDINIGQVLGETIYEPAIENSIDKKNKNILLNKYFVVGIIALIIITINIYWKYRNKKNISVS